MPFFNPQFCDRVNGAVNGAIHLATRYVNARYVSIVTAGIILAGAAWAGGEPNTHMVEIKGGKFVPNTITVAVGDTVRWINRDYIPHTATAQDAAKNSLWDTGNLNREQSGEVVFDSAGRMDYLCIYHPVMTGEVIIVDRIASRGQ